MGLDDPQLTTCLWFDTEAEAAANFYIALFKNSRITSIQRYTDAGKEVHRHEPGSALVVEFDINGHRFLGLNGGPHIKFNGSTSFVINCDTQEEVDYYWDKLREGGDEARQQCGWLADKFGVSWQVVPTILKKLMGDSDKEKAGRVTVAMMQMKKLDIASLQKAYDG